VLKAVEIHHPTFDTALAVEFRAKPSPTQEVPSRAFCISLVASQFANAGGWDAHGESIAGLRRLGRQLGLAREVTPHPSGDGWRRRPRRTPSPQGRGLDILLAILSARDRATTLTFAWRGK
jgi:hypothetical protein